MDLLRRLEHLSGHQLLCLLSDLPYPQIGKRMCGKKCEISEEPDRFSCIKCDWVICKKCLEVYYNLAEGCTFHEFFPTKPPEDARERLNHVFDTLSKILIERGCENATHMFNVYDDGIDYVGVVTLKQIDKKCMYQADAERSKEIETLYHKNKGKRSLLLFGYYTMIYGTF